MEGKEILDQIIVGRVDPYIYAFSTNTIPNYLKVGDTYRPVSVRLNEWKKYFPDLEEEYKEKAIINEDVFFRDYSVHKFIEEELGKTRLIESMLEEGIYYSNEFFENATSDDVKEAIKDIKKSYEKNDNKYQFYDARTSLPEVFQFKREDVEWEPRPNQQEAIDNFIKARANNRKNLLMYAVMRFGKSFTAMMCAKEMKAKLVVIVSAKADVKIEWKKTVEQPKNFKGYSFVSADELTRNNNEIKDRLNNGERVAVFLTLQDLQGDLIKDRHKDIFKNKIDLLIVDETHFGARADSYGKVLENTKYVHDIKDKYESEIDRLDELDDNIKAFDVDTTLHLSGTPYRILMGSEFENEDIISFCQFSDIVREQEQWDEENILDDETKEWKNPYYGFPQMIRFAFNPSKKAKEKLAQYKTSGYTYAFSALLKPKSISKSPEGLHKKFENEEEVLELFEAIDGSKNDENVLGFLNYDKIKDGKMCRHIVCVLPYCASCDALEELINNNKDKFKNLKDYKIINISGTDISNEFNKISKIKNAIKKCDEEDIKTLTLTVNRMLTGSTVEQWDTMIYLKDTSSPQEYDQSIFRLQNQYVKEYMDKDGNTIKYNMKPQTLLVDFDPYRMFALQEKKSKIYNVNVENGGNAELEERIKNELRISPIITMNKNKIVEIEPRNIMDAVSEYSREKGVMDEVNDIPVDLRLLDYEDIKNVIDKQAELGSSAGLSFDNTDDEDGDDIDIPNMEEGSNEKNDNNSNKQTDEELDNEQVNYEKKIRTYFARILFYAFLTNSEVISLSQIIESVKNNDINRRILKNLGLDLKVISLMNEHMNQLKLYQLDDAIRNLNKLSKDRKLTEIERANVALNKFKKLSQSEVITPISICKDMVDLIDKKKLKKLCKKGTRILDIASKAGEFSIASYEKLLKIGVDKNKIKSIIYSIPTSNIAYEFTRKIYEILDLDVDHIASKFNTYDLLNVKDDDGKVDYLLLGSALSQNIKFSEIDLNQINRKENNNMNFDIIVGNPPYQENISNEVGNASLAKQLFPSFVRFVMELNPKYGSLIIPSKWFLADAQDKSFIKLREYVKDNNHIKNMVSFTGNNEVFKDVNVGNVSYFLYDKDYSGDVEFVENSDETVSKVIRPLFEEGLDVILPINNKNLFSILKKVRESKDFSSLMEIANGRNAFGVVGKDSVVKKISKEEYFDNAVSLRCAHEIIRYIDETHITKNKEIMKSWKIITSKANGGAGLLTDNKQVSIIGKSYLAPPMSACTDSLIPIGCFDSKEEAENLLKYMSTKFLRFMVGIVKSSQNLYQPVYRFVPIQDFASKSDIDWNKNIHEIDLQLYKKYNLTDDEINYIESKIKEM